MHVQPFVKVVMKIVHILITLKRLRESTLKSHLSLTVIKVILIWKFTNSAFYEARSARYLQ